MASDTEKIQTEYLEILNSQNFIPKDLDYTILDKHIEFLEKLNVIENSCISIYDFYKKKHVYLSSRFETIFGFNIKDAYKEGDEYLYKKVHPNDNIGGMKFGSNFLNIVFSLPKKEKKNYKLINEYRLKSGEDKYIRVINQFQVLELDKHGNIWLALCVLDLSPNQDISMPIQSKVINFKTGELFHFPETTKEINLSEREKEILGLISEGLISKEIADNLFISVHTVNTHRQNILEKLNVKNSHEAIKLAKNYGLINYPYKTLADK